MKKICLLIVTFICLFTVTGFTQEPRFGFDLGFSICRGSYSPDAGIEERIIGGFDGGLLVEFTVGNKFKIQPELNYTICGVELNDGVSETSIKLQYLTIPILAKWNVSRKFNIIFGPQHGILLSAWNDPSGTITSSRIKEQFKFSDVIAVAGVEFKFNDNLFFAVRYNHGFEQIAEDASTFELKNRYLGIRMGYIFNRRPQ